MSYTAAALLGAGLALAVDVLVLRTRLVTRAVFWATYPIVVFFQLVSNGILTAREIVRYDPAAIVGWRLAYAPVEDLAFGFALVLLSLSLWVWWGRRGVDRERGGKPGRPERPAPRRGRRPARAGHRGQPRPGVDQRAFPPGHRPAGAHHRGRGGGRRVDDEAGA